MSLVPSDFSIEAISEGRMPHTPRYKLTITADGAATYSYQPNQKTSTVTVKRFHLDEGIIRQLYNLVKDSSFFELGSHDSKALDGDQIQLKVTMNKKTHIVLLINYPLKEFDDIIRGINSLIPEHFRLAYNSLILSSSNNNTG